MQPFGSAPVIDEVDDIVTAAWAPADRETVMADDVVLFDDDEALLACTVLSLVAVRTVVERAAA